jgi:hypothetical protein
MTLREYFMELNKREKKEFFDELTKRCQVTEDMIRKYMEFPHYGCSYKNQKIISEFVGISQKELFVNNS